MRDIESQSISEAGHEKESMNVRVVLVDAGMLESHLADLDIIATTERHIPRLFAPSAAHDARAIVMSRQSLDGFDLAETVARVRSAWPLVDLVIWSPRAESSFVRDALKAGAKDVLLTDSPEICSRAVANIISSQQMMPKAARLGFEQGRRAVFEGMLARSRAMWDLFDTATRVAATDAAILLLGETGTGKELLARAIHRRSERSGKFVAVNCAAIAENLIDSELFGHVKGAFTGATGEKAGLFRHADGGTLMLDEIGHMPAAAQHHLLRALQESTVRPVGAHKEIPVDVRIIASTSTSLEEDVEEGTFREDLFYRLDVIRLEIPPLRERPEDVLFLFGHFVRDFAKQYDVPRPEFTDGFLESMLKYEWPGNVRQLENFSERFVLTHGPGKANVEDLHELLPFVVHQDESPAPAPASPPSIEAPSAVVTAPVATEIALTRSLEETIEPVVLGLESAYLRECLRATRGRIEKAAGIAGISRRTLLRKLRYHGIDKNDYKRADRGGADSA